MQIKKVLLLAGFSLAFAGCSKMPKYNHEEDIQRLQLTEEQLKNEIDVRSNDIPKGFSTGLNEEYEGNGFSIYDIKEIDGYKELTLALDFDGVLYDVKIVSDTGWVVELPAVIGGYSHRVLTKGDSIELSYERYGKPVLKQGKIDELDIKQTTVKFKKDTGIVCFLNDYSLITNIYSGGKGSIIIDENAKYYIVLEKE